MQPPAHPALPPQGLLRKRKACPAPWGSAALPVSPPHRCQAHFVPRGGQDPAGQGGRARAEASGRGSCPSAAAESRHGGGTQWPFPSLDHGSRLGGMPRCPRDARSGSSSLHGGGKEVVAEPTASRPPAQPPSPFPSHQLPAVTGATPAPCPRCPVPSHTCSCPPLPPSTIPQSHEALSTFIPRARVGGSPNAARRCAPWGRGRRMRPRMGQADEGGRLSAGSCGVSPEL